MADTTSPAAATNSDRFVEIPKALPGQEYKSPKNFQNVLIRGSYQIAVVLMTLALPAAPAVIFIMILGFSHAIAEGLLWLWIVMIIFIETIAIGVAWGLAREALGLSGVSYSPARR